MLRQLSENGKIEAGRFIIRRIFKIWPAYYALLGFHFFWGRHPASSFLFQNAVHLQNYLGTSISQTWSLAVEEHFYLFLPAVLALCSRFGLIGGKIIGLFGGICVLVMLARCIAVYEGELGPAWVYTQYRIDSLLFGVILAAIYWFRPALYAAIKQNKRGLLLCVGGLAAWLMFGVQHIELDRSIGCTIEAFGFCGLLVLVNEHSGRLTRNFLYRFIAWIGTYSYGIYLWHTLTLVPGEAVIQYATALGLPRPAVWLIALVFQFSLAIALGYATTRIIEFPFLRIRDALFPDGQRRQIDPIAAKETMA